MLPVARRYVLLIPVMILISNTATLAYVIWPASSMEKIFRDTPARHMPTKGLKLYAACNEHIAAQLVISAQEKPLSQVKVSLSPLRHNRAYELSPEAVSLSLVKYVYLGAHDRDYPDPLAPLRPFDVKTGQNQPVWLAWVVPKDTPPGPYKGRVTVSIVFWQMWKYRDGIEDYQYLYLLACKSGSLQVSDKRVDGVLKSLEMYTREAATLDRVRNHIGRLLSR